MRRRSFLLLTGSTATLAGCMGDDESTTEDTSLEFVAGTEPSPDRTLTDNFQVEVENPPAVAEDVSLIDSASGKEIRSIAPRQDVDGTVTLNSIGGYQFVHTEDKTAAKEAIESNIEDMPSLTLVDELTVEDDIQELDGLFALEFEAENKIEFVGEEVIELVLLDGNGDQIEGTSEAITI